MHGNKTLFGYVNCAFYNQRAEGDRRFFLSREERDESLNGLRERAIQHGLAESAAKAGIYPVEARWAVVRSDPYAKHML
jgi:hypothetical protein